MNPGISKRQKERDRQEKAKAKLERKRQRRDEKDTKPRSVDGEDPDLAGIVPGPQPVLEEA